MWMQYTQMFNGTVIDLTWLSPLTDSLVGLLGMVL